ncbi:MAG: protein-tyrosine-phosphatase [Planctomycetales bacterium]|nr:protein-tyrosine-phosphatase [Planctomycetales bacterium]
MRNLRAVSLLPLTLVTASMVHAESMSPTWVEPLRAELALLDKSSPATERRQLLDQAAAAIRKQLADVGKAQLTFICTHNSRRSHLSQIWAQVAADYYGVAGVQTFSGGTEATACNIRTVRALRRAGLQVVATSDGSNPRYLVQFAEDRPSLTAFSKVYNEDGNPRSGFLAMMCCADADENCPVVHGSVDRIPLHYVDPKVADGTDAEAATYDQRSRQIGAEMFYMFRQVASAEAK